MLVAFDKHNTLMAEAQEGKGLFSFKVPFLYPQYVCNGMTTLNKKQTRTGILLENKKWIANSCKSEQYMKSKLRENKRVRQKGQIKTTCHDIHKNWILKFERIGETGMELVRKKRWLQGSLAQFTSFHQLNLVITPSKQTYMQTNYGSTSPVNCTCFTTLTPGPPTGIGPWTIWYRAATKE